MPEIKIKHVVSFSSEDKVHKAENLIKPETYRKWKCASPGEKSSTVLLQFEKATQIYSIDVGNESSAFVEVLVGRSSDSVRDFQVLLVASSFMSPLESRNGTHTNRVRMFGPDKLSQSTRDEKWDCVQVICTQPFNKSIMYGLSFIKFHSPPDKNEEQSKDLEAGKVHTKLGAFKLKFQDEEDDSPSVGSWFGKQKIPGSNNPSSIAANKLEPSYATNVLASSSNVRGMSPQNNTPKRKIDEKRDSSLERPAKKTLPTSALNKDNIVYKDVLRDLPEIKKRGTDVNQDVSNTSESRKMKAVMTELKKNASSPKTVQIKANTASASSKRPDQNPVKLKQNVPFNKILDKVVFVLSGFVNPLRGELRDKALEMGAKYKGDWDRSCTHLVCAFTNTPKYTQVQKLKGKIVAKEWILDCHDKREKLRWTNYILGRSSKADDSDDSDDDPDFNEIADDSDDDNNFSEEVDDSDDDPDFNEELDDSEEEDNKKKKRKNVQKNVKTKKRPGNPTAKNGNSSSLKNNPAPVVKNDLDTPTRRKDPSKINQRDISSNSSKGNMSDSETEDEEALQDYMAATDVDSDSGGDTEDEIQKVMKAQENGKSPSKKSNGSKKNLELSEAPNVADLPLPELPNLFKQKRFFLFGDFSSSKRHDLERFIIAYNGILEDYMNDKIKYVITEAKWDKNFEDALSENEDLIFVKPTWIYKCHKSGKLLPYQPYIVIPDS